jgi:lipocalin
VTYRVEPLSRDDLDETIRNYVCSTCWGPLDFKRYEGKWYAICRSCKEETVGYTSKRYAERMREQSMQELIEAERNMRNILGLKKRQTVEQNLEDLGFRKKE